VIHVVGLEVDPAIKEDSPISTSSSDAEKPGILAVIRQFFSSFAESINTPSHETAGWTIIFSDDLEGTFPGDWDVFDNDGPTNGEYFWVKKNCRPYAGSYSAWAVGGGVDGSGLPCNSDYPDNAKSWMIYGPFSLEEATDAEFRFMYWLNSEPSYDIMFVGASSNGTNFYGESTSGAQDWTEHIFDLTDVYNLGDLTSEPEVWVVIAFQSDMSDHYAEGAYVDDIELKQYVGNEPTATATSTASPTPTATPNPQNNTRFLSLVAKNFPFIPDAPVLNAISNGDGDGSYTVSWSSSIGANTYTLEEDDNIGFSSPTTVYSGSSTSKAISGRDIGTYYYRVNASNAYASSGWSNIVSVGVTIPLPKCPQAGVWSGTTNQGHNISFVVENSPMCQIAANSLSISIMDSCGVIVTIQFGDLSFPITNNHFTTGYSDHLVEGDFTSLTTVSGTFSYSRLNSNPPPVYCTASGKWTAHP
jgi:hypothetical protein